MYKDPYSTCSGKIVWDYIRGEVICSSTGEVIDRIYDYGPIRERLETIEQRNLLLKNRPKTNSIERRYRKHLRTYIVAQKMIKDKPWLHVDYDKLFETGKFIHTIRSKSTDQALKNVRRSGLEKKLKEMIDLIREIDPVAVSRTERAKLALAYILLNYIEKNTPPDIGETIAIFNISHTTYRRLERIARRLHSRITVKAEAPATALTKQV